MTAAAQNNISLAAHWGERAGVRRARSEPSHLTLPLLRNGPLPLPPMGGEGMVASTDR
jgi:hypothetical protein